MVNINAITPRRDLRLRREIMKNDEVNGYVYINDIPFTETELTVRVFDVLSEWDFQSKIHDDRSILYDFVRDFEMTNHLRHAYSVIESRSTSNIVCMMVTKTLREIANINESTDDIEVVTDMIVKLKDKQLTKTCLPFGRDVLSQVSHAIRPLRSYLEKLKECMLADGRRVQDIVDGKV